MWRPSETELGNGRINMGSVWTTCFSGACCCDDLNCRNKWNHFHFWLLNRHVYYFVKITFVIWILNPTWITEVLMCEILLRLSIIRCLDSDWNVWVLMSRKHKDSAASIRSDSEGSSDETRTDLHKQCFIFTERNLRTKEPLINTTNNPIELMDGNIIASINDPIHQTDTILALAQFPSVAFCWIIPRSQQFKQNQSGMTLLRRRK